MHHHHGDHELAEWSVLALDDIVQRAARAPLQLRDPVYPGPDVLDGVVPWSRLDLL